MSANTPAETQQLTATERAERQRAVVQALGRVLPQDAILYTPEDTTPYECDGLTAYRERPLVVALPETEAQVQAVLKACHALQVPVVARGAGTGLSGGAMPHKLGVTLSLTVSDLASFYERVSGVHLFDAYFVNYLPTELLLSDVIWVSITAFILSFLATLYPAYQAGRIQPAEALRYE